jgi:nitrogen-specific signal transduction histidine kinase/HAMP domain-containing protein
VRLKTKLVLAITGMVVAIVATLSSIYISQLIRQRTDEAFQNAQFITLELFNSAREALENDLSNSNVNLSDPAVFNDAVEESLQSDAGLSSLLQSVVGYSPTVYDIAITDGGGKAMIHTNPGVIGRVVAKRDDLDVLRSAGFWNQLRSVYGEPKVYEVRLPMERNGVAFATIRVGISTVFLKKAMQEKLNKAVLIALSSILLAIIVAAFLSNLALRPLERISRRLDEMAAAVATTQLPAVQGPAPPGSKDEYGAVNTKIEYIGQQMRDVKEVFSAMKENLDQIMSNLQDGVMLFSREDRVVMASASMERFLHKDRSELMARKVEEIFADRTLLGDPIVAAFHDHRAIPGIEVHADPASPGGESPRVALSLDFIEENGERIGAILTLRDAESVHRIEDELELSRRMAAVGRLTSGVAHEVKNPINAIVVHLELLRQKAKEPDPDVRRHMDVIGSEIRRLDRVVQTLVDFTRPMELRLNDADLTRILDDIVTLASPDAEKHGVHIVRDIPSDALPVKIDIDLVKQAILNIMINGMQAMTKGGNLTVTAQREDGDALVEITDQGGGIPPEIREKIFNLYFTTKSGGSGIGLPMTYRVLQLHNGSLDFDSTVGEGTTFRLRFPLSERNARETWAEAARTAPSGRLD